MSDQKSAVKIKHKDQEPTFLEWLVHGKGTVSEPWPTVEEVLADPNVKKEIKKVHSAFKKYKKSQNGKQKI